MSKEYPEVEEKVKFLTLGKKRVKKADTSYVIEKGETVTGVVTEIKDSGIYKKVYVLKVEDCPEPIIITGKTDLNEKFGFGKMVVTPLKKGDKVKITWDGTYEAKNGVGFRFTVGIKRS